MLASLLSRMYGSGLLTNVPPIQSPEPSHREGASTQHASRCVGEGIDTLSQYKTEELQRVVEAVPGSTYVIEGCVFTTATYGETFRPITRTRYGGLPQHHDMLSCTL